MAKYLVVIARSWPVTQKLPLALHKLSEGLSQQTLGSDTPFLFYFLEPKIYGTKGAGPKAQAGALTNSTKGTKLCA